MPHSLLPRISRFIDALSEWSGRTVSWLVLAMVLVIAYDVGMRYLFQIGSVALQELEWHLFALLFLLGASYTFKHDGHVRVDLIYRSRWMNDKRRAWVEIFGTLLLLFPFCLLIIISSAPFVSYAFAISEGSPDPGGLPYRFLLKAAIPLGFSLLILQGLAHLIRCALIVSDKAASPPLNNHHEDH
ncbi:TRAP transporter small permease subunit [Kaarinaea lacus]